MIEQHVNSVYFVEEKIHRFTTKKRQISNEPLLKKKTKNEGNIKGSKVNVSNMKG